MFDELQAMIAQLQHETAERKRIEASLRLSEANFLRIFQTCPNPIAIATFPDGCLVAANASFAQLCRLPVEAVLERSLAQLDLGSPHLWDDWIQALWCQQGLDRQPLEVQTPQGGRPMLLSGAPLDWDREQFVLYLTDDLEKLQQREATWRSDAQKYRNIFENAVDGMFQTTAEGQFLNANPALAELYGYESPEALIEHFSDIGRQLYVQPERRSEFIAYMRCFGQVSNFESQVYRKDGSMIWVSENVRAVKDAQGQLLYYEGSIVEITERRQMEEELRRQRRKAEHLLLNILPQPIAERLKTEKQTIADSFAEVTVLFADIVEFTALSAQISPRELVHTLNQIFSTFDGLSERYGLEKIKTIGDAYMAVGGLSVPNPNHAEAVADMALEMQAEIQKFKRPGGSPFQLRIGINTGPVVAGVIGIKKFIYDLWGDTVNVASRMESHGIAGIIQVTPSTYDRLKHRYDLQHRGPVHIKGIGDMETYLLLGKSAELSVDLMPDLQSIPWSRLPES